MRIGATLPSLSQGTGPEALVADGYGEPSARRSSTPARSS